MDTRTQIRNKILTLLGGISGFENKVFYDHLYGINESKLPCVVVNTGLENFNNISIGSPFVIEKTLNLNISVATIVKGDFQSTLEDFKNKIEKKINENNRLDGLVQSCYITSIEMEVDDDRDVPLSYLTITVEVIYRVVSNNIDTII